MEKLGERSGHGEAGAEGSEVGYSVERETEEKRRTRMGTMMVRVVGSEVRTLFPFLFRIFKNIFRLMHDGVEFLFFESIKKQFSTV